MGSALAALIEKPISEWGLKTVTRSMKIGSFAAAQVIQSKDSFLAGHQLSVIRKYCRDL
jgi:hypothetical protein